MPDREKVIKGLEICKNPHGRCAECQYDDGELDLTNCTSILCGDALALLKKQETQKFLVDESGKITPLPVVVRCKDCKHYDKKTGRCALRHVHGCTETWFCADGERKPTQTNAKNNALDVR
ncbi:MAG: hypothetical protein II008_22160 [Oscillospiraceae bacterium]|nr:hypothetical protein [Oscillospiraceae bacterium]